MTRTKADDAEPDDDEPAVVREPDKYAHSSTVQMLRDTNAPAMPRSRIEIYWKIIESAPEGVTAQVRVTDGCGSDYLLPYPCKLTKDGWVNAASGKPLAVRATYWKLYVETTPRKKAGDRSTRLDVPQPEHD